MMYKTIVLPGGFIGRVTEDNPTLENCYVYDTSTSIADTKASFKKTGIIVGSCYMNLPNYEAKVTTTNCYYGKCTVDADFTTDGNAGTAVEKTEAEFADGTVKGFLGDAIYPRGKVPDSGIFSCRTSTKDCEAIAAAEKTMEALSAINGAVRSGNQCRLTEIRANWNRQM